MSANSATLQWSHITVSVLVCNRPHTCAVENTSNRESA